MSDQPKFGRLQDVLITEAWAHEARDFTPWLAGNLDRLSEVLGVPLVLIDREVPVDQYVADILARSGEEEHIVLIENQLYQSDHAHLGQIMTYLAGLQAKTVVWIASNFNEPHLSAIRWLNEHTEEPFAFFAVTLRVVRIGESALVPLFDVVERPNNWDRRLHTAARDAADTVAMNALRQEFWAFLLDRHPSERRAEGTKSRWYTLAPLELVVAQYFTKSHVGLSIRGLRRIAGSDTEDRLRPIAVELTELLDARIGSNNYFFYKWLNIDTADRANWDRAADWLKEQTDLYVQTLNDIVGKTS
jgi:hypothetical protein